MDRDSPPRRLRTVLIQEGLAGRSTDYFGRTIKLFGYKEHNLTHLQGGGYVLSRRAAIALAACKHGPWRNCPPASRGGVFRDIHNRAADKVIQSRCDTNQVNAEDLLTGVCMYEAGIVPAHNPCMKALGAATVHANAPEAKVKRPNDTLRQVRGQEQNDARILLTTEALRLRF